jgi:hypothetical protein
MHQAQTNERPIDGVYRTTNDVRPISFLHSRHLRYHNLCTFKECRTVLKDRVRIVYAGTTRRVHKKDKRLEG